MHLVDFKLYEAPQGDNGDVKKWAIGFDERGVHTFFTEPGATDLIYYHKPLLTDFDNDDVKAEEYVRKKISEKIKKNYRRVLCGKFDSSKRVFY